jgi:hypothetical protein
VTVDGARVVSGICSGTLRVSEMETHPNIHELFKNVKRKLVGVSPSWRRCPWKAAEPKDDVCDVRFY